MFCKYAEKMRRLLVMVVCDWMRLESMEDCMAHMADGPLGPALRDRGFERLGDLSEPARMRGHGVLRQ